MPDLKQERRKAAVRSLFKLAVLEAVLIAAVVVIYLYTGNILYLVGGVVGSTLIAAPMFFRWVRDQQEEMRERSQSDEAGNV